MASHLHTHGCAVGCILSPLRGWVLRWRSTFAARLEYGFVPSVIAREVCSVTSAPTEPEAEYDACCDGAGEFLAIGNRNEASLLVSDLDHADWNCSRSSSAAASFATGFGITHSSGASSGSVSVSYFCNRD